MRPKGFNDLEPMSKENLYMETAMIIMETYCDMSYVQKLNPDKLDMYDRTEKVGLFREWARDFEHKYYGTEKYNDEFIELCEEFAKSKLLEEFGFDK